ncbi:pyridoxal phosphate-dependent transferase, partial [Gorgonomyces haynaldii]
MLLRPDFDLEKITRPNIWALKPYRCARDDFSEGILLDANENAYGPSFTPEIHSEFKTISSDYHLERYPDPRQDEIKKRLCALRHINSVEHFFVGVGSDECIDLAMRIFCVPGKDKVLITPPTYGMYSVSAHTNDVGVVKVNLNVQDGLFQLDVDQMISVLQQDALIKIVFLCSPGNPTGTLLKKSDIERILLCPEYKGIVFVDEAYIDFDEQQSVSQWVQNYPNLIVSQTLSKAFGLAGVRLGVSMSSPEIASLFNKTKAPYNVSTPASLIAKQALSEKGLEGMREHVRLLVEQRARLVSEFGKIPYFGKILGANDANFILVPVIGKSDKPCNKSAFAIYQTLAQVQGVVVRFRGNEHGCEGCLRVTVGTKDENTVLLERL